MPDIKEPQAQTICAPITLNRTNVPMTRDAVGPGRDRTATGLGRK